MLHFRHKSYLVSFCGKESDFLCPIRHNTQTLCFEKSHNDTDEFALEVSSKKGARSFLHHVTKHSISHHTNLNLEPSLIILILILCLEIKLHKLKQVVNAFTIMKLFQTYLNISFQTSRPINPQPHPHPPEVIQPR